MTSGGAGVPLPWPETVSDEPSAIAAVNPMDARSRFNIMARIIIAAIPKRRKALSMRRLRRLLVVAAQVCVAAVVVHTLLVGIQYTLFPAVHGQAKPNTAAQTNGTRGAKPYTTWSM